MDPVFVIVRGQNRHLISEVSRLYLRQTDLVADLTYGRGNFWRDRYHDNIITSDITPVADIQADFRKLPYKNNSFDVVVLDPPYVHDPSNTTPMWFDSRYKNNQTTAKHTTDDIMDLYRAGMIEGRRILKPNGLLWIKCIDQVSAGRQHWGHIEIKTIADELKLYAKDMFILLRAGGTAHPWKTQHHARRNCSFLWIFRK